MNTNLNQAIISLRLTETESHPNLNEVLAELKTQETNFYRSKVISLSQAVLENPDNEFQNIELSTSLNKLDMLQSS